MDKITKYLPLLALVFVAFLGSLALTYGVEGGAYQWMHYFMGLLFSEFALLKLFNVPSFADGFQKYDMIAMKMRGYALVYPFIELGLGLSYLAFLWPNATYLITILFMGLGTIGVIKALKKGLDVRCACMGTALNVPLSTVTLTEDIGMGLMALWMLVQ